MNKFLLLAAMALVVAVPSAEAGKNKCCKKKCKKHKKHDVCAVSTCATGCGVSAVSYAEPVSYAAPVETYSAPAASSCGCSSDMSYSSSYSSAPVESYSAPVEYSSAPMESYSAPVEYSSAPMMTESYSAPTSSCGCGG